MKKYLVAFVATSFAASSLASQGGLSEADQKKVVCVPVRNSSGAVTSQQICKSGFEWEKVLRVARQPASGQIPNAVRWSALAGR